MHKCYRYDRCCYMAPSLTGVSVCFLSFDLYCPYSIAIVICGNIDGIFGLLLYFSIGKSILPNLFFHRRAAPLRIMFATLILFFKEDST